jgi:hypothetical protein
VLLQLAGQERQLDRSARCPPARRVSSAEPPGRHDAYETRLLSDRINHVDATLSLYAALR